MRLAEAKAGLLLPAPRTAASASHRASDAQVRRKRWSRPISRVLSWATIHLRYASPRTSSDLPGDTCGPHVRSNPKTGPLAPLFGLAPGGVCRATECYHRRGALLPHHFTLTVARPEGHALRRFTFCCTFRGLAPPRRYLAPCPGSPDFPPRLRAAVAWPTPPRIIQVRTALFALFRAAAQLHGARVQIAAFFASELCGDLCRLRRW